MSYKTTLTAPPTGDVTAAAAVSAWWGAAFDSDGSDGRPDRCVHLNMDELDDLELAIARVRAQCGRPRLLWTVGGVRGHRFDEAGDAIGFYDAQIRQYDDAGPAVIVTSSGDRFPFDATVEVWT